jgi:hypothetical protein
LKEVSLSSFPFDFQLLSDGYLHIPSQYWLPLLKEAMRRWALDQSPILAQVMIILSPNYMPAYAYLRALVNESLEPLDVLARQSQWMHVVAITHKKAHMIFVYLFNGWNRHIKSHRSYLTEAEMSRNRTVLQRHPRHYACWSFQYQLLCSYADTNLVSRELLWCRSELVRQPSNYSLLNYYYHVAELVSGTEMCLIDVERCLETFPENSALTAFKRHLLRIQQRTPEQ